MEPDDIFCGECGTRRDNAAGTGTRAGLAAGPAGVSIRDVVGSQIAVGDGNVQIRMSVDGTSQFGHHEGGIELRAREIPVLTAAGRTDLIGRDALIGQAAADLSRGISVKLFGVPGVGRSAVAAAVIRRQAAAQVRGVELFRGNQAHTLESVYRRLVLVFFGMPWFEPEEAVLRLEVAKADLRALVLITDCDLPPGDLGRLLGTFSGCTFLLTSRQQTLPADAGAVYEVDPLTSSQARELMTRALGEDPSGLQNLQWEQAHRLAGGQVQRLIEHVAFIKRAATRPGQTGLLNVPVKDQVAILIAGLTEPARRVLVAMATYPLALAATAFGAVTGLPQAPGTADELITAGLIAADGPAFRIAQDAAEVLGEAGERADPEIAASGISSLLGKPEPVDPQLVLAVARAVHEAGDDASTSRLTRAGAPRALAAGEIGVWASLVALGFQAATTSRRKADLEFFLNEQHTSSLLRGDAVAAAAALATLGELLAQQQGPAAPGTHLAIRATRTIRHGRRSLLSGHHAIATIATTGVIAVGATVAVSVIPAPHPVLSLTGAWIGSGGGTFTFTPAGQDRYAISLQSNGCPVAADGEVTGSNGHFKGSINLYNQNVNANCATRVGVAATTIDINPGNSTARVLIAKNTGCTNCGAQTWTRAKTRT
jgi:hypothetical protein